MARLRDACPEQNLRVTVEPQEEPVLDFSESPYTVTSEAQLIELLQEGLESPTQEVTEETWAYIREEVYCRAAQRP